MGLTRTYRALTLQSHTRDLLILSSVYLRKTPADEQAASRVQPTAADLAG